MGDEKGPIKYSQGRHAQNVKGQYVPEGGVQTGDNFQESHRNTWGAVSRLENGVSPQWKRTQENHKRETANINCFLKEKQKKAQSDKKRKQRTKGGQKGHMHRKKRRERNISKEKSTAQETGKGELSEESIPSPPCILWLCRTRFDAKKGGATR